MEIVLENWSEDQLKMIQKVLSKMGLKKLQLYTVVLFHPLRRFYWMVPSKSIAIDYLNEILKLDKKQISKPIKINNNIVIIRLNDKRSLNQNEIDLVKIEKNIINKKKEEKLNIFSDSHYLDLGKKSYVEINE